VLREQGRDADAVLAQPESDGVKAALRAQCDEAQRFGMFGAANFVIADGEKFWGQRPARSPAGTG
jgi:2-hydroxychromene-2-carboxylate isomerase